jgi:hypothetical protein
MLTSPWLGFLNRSYHHYSVTYPSETQNLVETSKLHMEQKWELSRHYL